MAKSSRKAKPPTLEEWVAELNSIAGDQAEGVTMREVMDGLRLQLGAARERLKKAIASGAWVCVGKKQVYGIDGRLTWSPAYAPKKR